MTPEAWVRLASALVAAGTLDERCDVLVRHGAATERALTEVGEHLARLALADPVFVEAVAEACVETALRIGAVLPAAIARYHWARVLVGRGELERALTLIEASRVAYLTAGRPLQALRTQLGRMHVLDEMGRHEEAAVVGEAALVELPLANAAEHDDELATWLRAAVSENVGVAYGFTDAHEKALAAYTTAETAYAALDMAPDLARVRANRGVELVEAGFAAEGAAALEVSAAEFEAGGDRVWYAKCLGHHAVALMMLGRYVEALALLERARRTIDGLGADAEAARLTARLADASLALSLNDEAYDLASEAAERFRSAGMTHDLADALLHCGVASVRAGRLGRAAVRLDEARTLFVQVGASARAAETALAQAEVLRSSGDAAAARSLTVAAVEQLSGGEFPAQLALALMQLADDSGGEVARRHLMRAASLVDHLGLPALAHPLHLRLGRSYRQANDLDGAREHLEAAVDVIEGLQGTVADEMLRAVFLGDKRAAIDELADLLLCLPEPDVHRAFVVCERARARTLLERATVRGAEAVPSVVRPEDAADASAARELNAVYNALLSDDGRGGNERRRALHERAAVLERSATVARLKQVTEGPLDRDHASVAPALVTGDREPVPAPVLTYEVIGDSIDVFAGTGPSVRHRRLPVTATGLLATLRELEQQWSYCELGGPFVERNGEALIAGSTTVLRTLHDQLVAPVADLLPGGSGEGGGGADTVRHLTVVPSKLVHRVPFAALHDGSGHLLAQHVIATSPSAGTVPIDPSRMRPRLDRALVIGVSDATIPRAADEARAVGALLPGATVLVDDDATVARFLDLAPRAGVVHLACHGLHRADNPLFSAIRLSDGWITGHDVLRLQLGGTTVVLSACESGRHGSGGSEPVGLSWAFVAAGAQAVVVSLWAVDDGATEHLMTELYRGLIAGFGHAEALRTAQLATAAAWPHPYYWAPFVVVGPYDHGQPWRSS